MKERSDGLTLIALYHFICGALGLLGLCATVSIWLVVGVSAAEFGGSDGGAATAVFALIGLFAGGFLLLLVAANIIVGWGLWNHREWARLTAIALSIVSLINIPIGTIIGGLIIWYLLQDNVKAEFTRAA